MRLSLLIILISTGWHAWAQQLFPVKVEKRWGLIDADGQVVAEKVVR